MGTDDTADVFPVNVEIGRLSRLLDVQRIRCGVITNVAVNDFIVLRVLDNLEDFLARAGNVRTRTANKNGVLSRRFPSFASEFDRKSLVLADDSVIRSEAICKEKGELTHLKWYRLVQ